MRTTQIEKNLQFGVNMWARLMTAKGIYRTIPMGNVMEKDGSDATDVIAVDGNWRLFSADLTALGWAEPPFELVSVFFSTTPTNRLSDGVIHLDDITAFGPSSGPQGGIIEGFEGSTPWEPLANQGAAPDLAERARSSARSGGLGLRFSWTVSIANGQRGVLLPVGPSPLPAIGGPEFQLGHLVGEAYDEPVLLIKTAWGGKSIHRDFRPPSSGGSTGEFYKNMLAEYREGLAKLGDEFPQLAKRKPELSGFVWFQGWNDMFDDDALREYEANLVNLIKDVRREFRQPNLPVVIGELGNGGPKAGNNMLTIRKAQKAAAKALGPNTTFVQTTQFARPAKESPNVGHGHHWYGNAESYFLIGDALGQALLRLTGK